LPLAFLDLSVYYLARMKRNQYPAEFSFKKLVFLTGISLLVIAAFVVVVYLEWEAISSWGINLARGITQTFGWGLVLIALAILTLAVVILAKPIILLRYWNRFIGGFILFAAIWGILGFMPGTGYLSSPVNLGGFIGQSIIGHPGVVGALVIVGLVILGTFMVVPRGFAHLVYNSFCWITGKLRKQPLGEVPLPSPSAAPRLIASSNSGDEIPRVFPRYKPEPMPSAPKPVAASERSNWLWDRLHSKPGSEVAAASSVMTEIGAIKTVEAAETVHPENRDNPVAEPLENVISEDKPGHSLAAVKSVEARKESRPAAQEVKKKIGDDGSLVTADGWKLPPLEILDNTPEVEFSQADNLKKAKLIEDALFSYGVEGKVVQINVGPTVTQFGIEPGWDRKLKEVKEKDKNGDVRVKVEEVAKTRVKVDRITSLSNDLSLALAAPSIRIEAPVPGKSVVGIEVPNTTIGTVSLRSVVESNVYQKLQAKAKLSMALGKGAGGESVVGDMTKMPHLLIAGATGSGKTVCMHSIICCFLLYNTPRDLRFIMIDPKRVEMTSYHSLPHLATPVIVDNNKALGALRWLSGEMDKRYQTMAAARARNIEAYNKAKPNEKLPYLVLIIDELADLMMTAGEEVEHTLCRLAQLARATGIHLIVATQRPSVDVVTGLIKANFPSRISFAVTSQVDSRTILDSGGAEKLLGRGDMLYMPTEAAKPKRLQGCFVSDPEIERLVFFWNSQEKVTASQVDMDEIIAADMARAEKGPDDPLLAEARKLLDQHDKISASFLQRHLRIGYPRAARLMEQLEEEMGEGISELEDVKEEEEGKW
jgi:DNA segregation ATPase FtsK/SpoIIIE, S-DNA-T family